MLLLFQRSFVQFIWLQLDANVFCIQPSARQQIIFKTKNEKKKNGYDFWRHCLLNRAHNIFSTVFFVSNTTVSLFSLCWSIFALIRQNVTSLFATSGIIWSETIIKTNIAYIVLFTPIGEPRYQYGLWLLDRSISNESVQIDFLINLLAHFFTCTFEFVWVFRVRISLESF